MKNERIMELISEALEVHIEEPNALLDTIPEFDSMRILMVMEIFEQKNVDLFPQDFTGLITISDLINLIQSK